MTAYILDTETTGLTERDQIWELAYFEVWNSAELYRNLEITNKFWESVGNEAPQSLFKPSVPCHPEAQKVNGFNFSELKGKPHPSTIKLPSDMEIMIGHNVQFDWRMLGKPPVFLICTKQLAQKVWDKKKKNIPLPENYKLETLIRFLYPEEADELLNRKYHRALDDCKLTYLLLVKILEYYKKVEDLEQLVNMCTQGK